eukprot:c5285_g1_i2.p1 GENE.c5285_g1_i2~~c5285_g1_i2.p1  ORF type:complete len:148 (+),score=38.67 c5285_g1_i2:37-480(+)
MPKTERVRTSKARVHPYKTAMEIEEDKVDTEIKKLDTLGSLDQKHKLESRALRRDIERLKQQRLHTPGHTMSGKQQKKTITQEIKKLQQELKDKHTNEINNLKDSISKESAAQDEPEVGDPSDEQEDKPSGFRYRQVDVKRRNKKAK